MLNRITNAMLVNRSLRHINDNAARMHKTQQQISSGKMINIASDDPIGATQSMSLTGGIKKIDQYRRNIEDGVSVMENTSSILSQIEEILLQIKGVASNASSEVTTSAERSAFAFQVDQMLRELVQLANSKFQGKFVLGGTETLSGTKPNSAPFNIQMSGSKIASVIQNPDGLDGEIKRLVGEGKSITININGDDVFQPNGLQGKNDIFDTIIKLRENLFANDGDSIRVKVNEIDSEFNQVVSQNTLLGAKVNRLDLVRNQLDDLKLIQKDQLSSVQDTDIAEAIMRLKTQEVTFNATLSTSSRILSSSLLDYI